MGPFSPSESMARLISRLALVDSPFLVVSERAPHVAEVSVDHAGLFHGSFSLAMPFQNLDGVLVVLDLADSSPTIPKPTLRADL